ncbi:MAG TPA: hypothetical protein VG015_09455 [Candidatus Dormibacteraeota bacterium]|nr:hypothetical protein [Candidatus Dormibacteraeota bacterium]
MWLHSRQAITRRVRNVFVAFYIGTIVVVVGAVIALFVKLGTAPFGTLVVLHFTGLGLIKTLRSPLKD